MVLPADQEDYDGTLLPTDFKQAGQIRDTELARLMVHGLPAGVVLHALFDSCHSGQVTGAVECRPGMHVLGQSQHTSVAGDIAHCLSLTLWTRTDLLNTILLWHNAVLLLLL